MKLGYIMCAIAGLMAGAVLVAHQFKEDQRAAKAAAARVFIETHHCVEVGEPRGVWKRGVWRCDKGLTAIKETP